MWGQFRSVEHAETAARAGTHVEHATALLHARHDACNEVFHLWQGLLNGQSHLLVFCVYIYEQFVNALLLEVVIE